MCALSQEIRRRFTNLFYLYKQAFEIAATDEFISQNPSDIPKHPPQRITTNQPIIMSDVHQNGEGLIEYIRGVWPQSMFQRRFLRALGVMSVTTCVWMSGRVFAPVETSQNQRNIMLQRRLLMDGKKLSQEELMELSSDIYSESSPTSSGLGTPRGTTPEPLVEDNPLNEFVRLMTEEEALREEIKQRRRNDAWNQRKYDEALRSIKDDERAEQARVDAEQWKKLFEG